MLQRSIFERQERKKKDPEPVTPVEVWMAHLHFFNICFGFGEDATNDHYDVTATSEKADYGEGR